MYHKKDTVPQGRQAEMTSSTENKRPPGIKERKQTWWSIQDMELRVTAMPSVPLLGETALML